MAKRYWRRTTAEHVAPKFVKIAGHVLIENFQTRDALAVVALLADLLFEGFTRSRSSQCPPERTWCAGLRPCPCWLGSSRQTKSPMATMLGSSPQHLTLSRRSVQPRFVPSSPDRSIIQFRCERASDRAALLMMGVWGLQVVRRGRCRLRLSRLIVGGVPHAWTAPCGLPAHLSIGLIQWHSASNSELSLGIKPVLFTSTRIR